MEFNPPLNHILMQPYIACFGVDEIAIKLPSLIWGILLIPLMFWLGATIHSRQAGLYAALFAAVSPQANYFSCQARPYSLSCFLNCIAMLLFCRLFSERPTNKNYALILFVIAATALCYASTFGCFALASFTVATIVIFFRQKLSAHGQEIISTKRMLIACGFPVLFFLPWLPTMLHQAKMVKSVDPCTFAQLPWAFGVCLVTMLPLPLLLSIWLSEGAVCAVVIAALLRIIRGKTKRTLWLDLRSKSMTLPANYIMLLAMMLCPALVMGVFAGVWLGYFRYIYQFSPAQWLLLAAGIAKLMSHPSKLRKWMCALGLIFLLSINTAYICWFDQKSLSGLRPLAEAVRKGTFDNSVILLAPDFAGPVLHYYLSDADEKKHNVRIYGFVRSDARSLVMGDELPAIWSSATIVDECVKQVEKFHDEGYKYLAFSKDSEIFGNAKMPLSTRVQQLFQILNSKYKAVKTERYSGVTETMEVTYFKL